MEKSFDFGKLLQNNEKKHKSIPVQFVSVAGGVKKRLETDIKKRKNVRRSVFDKIRNLPRAESPVPIKEVLSKVEYRRIQLEKWKVEKDKKKKEAQLQKKKPFVAGVAHNALKLLPPPPPKPMPSISGRVTRSQAARNNNHNITKQKTSKETKSKNDFNKISSFAPKNATFNPVLKDLLKPVLEPSKKVDKKTYAVEAPTKKSKPKAKLIKTEPKNLRSRPARKSIVRSKKDASPKKSTLSSMSSSSVESGSVEKSPIIKINTARKSIERLKLITPKSSIPKSESRSEEKLRSPKLADLPMTPQQIVEEAKKISPCVTLSRGKDNARKEMKKKMEEGLLDDDLCEMDSVEHFRRQLDSEVKRMTEMCETWEKISEQVPLPEAVQEAVLSAVGQARLLMSQKLQQFASLLVKCECPEIGQALVTPGDLHGFWDMVFMQVENVDMKFKKLEEIKARGWTEEKPVEIKKKTVVKAAVNKNKPAATSRLKDMIAAARKAKKEQSEQIPEQTENKTFEAGFFKVQSPVKSPKSATPVTKSNLLKAVLSNEANKASASKKAASYAMLRASVLSKSVDSDNGFTDQVPLPPINLHLTPARSILKSNSKSARKLNKVLFNDSDQEPVSDAQNMDDVKSNANIENNLSTKNIENKENRARRKPKLTRQDGFEGSPVMTRSRRKSMHTPQDKKKLTEVNTEDYTQTPRRSRRKSVNVEML